MAVTKKNRDPTEQRVSMISRNECVNAQVVTAPIEGSSCWPCLDELEAGRKTLRQNIGTAAGRSGIARAKSSPSSESRPCSPLEQQEMNAPMSA